MRFIGSLLAAGDGRPTVIVLDNASIHHGIDEATRERWLIDHKAPLFYHRCRTRESAWRIRHQISNQFFVNT
jgi:hypothetical protein